MEQVINKAIEGGYGKKDIKNAHDWILKYKIVCDPLFWKALAKACGWEGHSPADVTSGECEYMGDWIGNGITFHEINLTEGWDKAVEYLSEVTK